MRIFLPFLCVLCATPVHNIFDGTCLRKDPPPGVLVLSPGSKLVLTCSGLVKVDGVKVSVTRKSSNTNRSTIANTLVSVKSDTNSLESDGYHIHPTEAGVNTVTGENRHLTYTDTQYTAYSTFQTVQPTSVSRRLRGESGWEAEDMVGEGEYEEEQEEEQEEDSRETRGIKLRPQWKWNGRTVGKGDRDWGDVTFERKGAVLSLASVRPKDSGNYTCHHRGRETLSLKVTVVDPPETPSLSCYKRSPSSKIRCEWTPQKPVKRLNCYLLLRKSPSETFLPLQCSYSSHCWCALDHNEDELRTLHIAYLCVTNIAGNATSTVLTFTPLDILKPNPPSGVSVQQEEGQESRMRVTWSLPTSWKHQDRHYELIYEIKYQPCSSSCSHGQTKIIEDQHSYTITDAMPGVKYLIQLRSKDEFDGQWSDWSTPVYASSWMASPAVLTDLTTTEQFPTEGSGTDDIYPSDVPLSVHHPVEVSHHVLWISSSFGCLVLLSLVILAVYMFRHKERFMSKLHRLHIITQVGDSSQPPPSAPTAPEGQALMISAPRRCKVPRLSEGEGEEEREEEIEDENRVNARIEATHFNNTSYFLVQRE
ncbi:hypothetical protein PAMP_003117 [Pampus punctatissimus]